MTVEIFRKSRFYKRLILPTVHIFYCATGFSISIFYFSHSFEGIMVLWAYWSYVNFQFCYIYIHCHRSTISGQKQAGFRLKDWQKRCQNGKVIINVITYKSIMAMDFWLYYTSIFQHRKSILSFLSFDCYRFFSDLPKFVNPF